MLFQSQYSASILHLYCIASITLLAGSVSRTTAASAIGSCPELVISAYDPSLNFTSTIDYVTSRELMLSGAGFTTASLPPECLTRTDISAECSDQLTLGTIPQEDILIPGTNQIKPFYRALISDVCDYSAIADRWEKNNPDIPINLDGNVADANPQGFYYYFGTQKRGPLLEIHHPFFDANRRHPVRSFGKSFSAAVALSLMDKGMLDLDVPIYTFVPALNRTEEMKNITVRNVLTHTTGFVFAENTEFRNPDISMQKAVEYLADGGLVYPTGKNSMYSTDAFQILGAAVEAITNKSWHTVWQENFAKPLNMSNTGYFNDLSFNDSVANPTIGHAIATPGDTAKFMRMLGSKGLAADRTTRVLSEKAVEMMTTWAGILPGFTPEGGILNIPEPSCSDNATSEIGSYGLGIWLQNTFGCARHVLGLGAYQNVYIILDKDSEDPVELIFLAALQPQAIATGSGNDFNFTNSFSVIFSPLSMKKLLMEPIAALYGLDDDDAELTKTVNDLAEAMSSISDVDVYEFEQSPKSVIPPVPAPSSGVFWVSTTATMMFAAVMGWFVGV